VVKGDEMEFRDHGDGAIKDKKVTCIDSAEAERTIEGAESGQSGLVEFQPVPPHTTPMLCRQHNQVSSNTISDQPLPFCAPTGGLLWWLQSAVVWLTSLRYVM